MKIQIGAVVICDGDQENPKGLRVTGKRNPQLGKFLRAAGAKFFPRYNRVTTISFTVQRGHDTYGQAELFAASHDAAVPEVGDIVLTAHDGSAVTWVAGACTDCDSKHEGVLTTTDYVLAGGLPAVS